MDTAPLISVIVPVHNGSGTLRRCLEAVISSDYANYECIVVDDASTDDSADIAKQFLARTLAIDGGPHGPAYARNWGAEVARGGILFFLDADVTVHRDALTRLAETFECHPDVDAVFGSYDDKPEAADFVSQFKNLSHHFVHQQGLEDGGTFWSGCGAIRREVFIHAGGFDEGRYPRPSIEDIDLGCRLRASGHRIMLNKAVQATHLKRWTLKGMARSDVFDRGIPWTLLILGQRNLPNDLNLRFSQRISAILLYAVLLNLALAAFVDPTAAAMLLMLAALSLIVVASWQWSTGRAPVMSSRALLVVCCLLAAIGILAAFSRSEAVIVSLVPAVLSALGARLLPRARILWSHSLFVVMTLGLAAAFVLVLLSLPPWLATPPAALVCAIVLLNLRFYAFLTARRGLAFAAAAAPFQMLYYFYSVLALLIGIGLHVQRTRLARAAAVAAASGTFGQADAQTLARPVGRVSRR